jgi:hypothetical protein
VEDLDRPTVEDAGEDHQWEKCSISECEAKMLVTARRNLRAVYKYNYNYPIYSCVCPKKRQNNLLMCDFNSYYGGNWVVYFMNVNIIGTVALL